MVGKVVSYFNACLADRSMSLLPGVRGVGLLASVTIASDVTKLRHRVPANNSNETEMS